MDKFSTDSENIIEQIFNKNHNNCNFSTLNEDVFSRLFEFLKKNDIKYNNVYNNNNYRLNEYVINKKPIDYPLNDFVCDRIKEYIKNKIKISYNYTIKINNKTIHLYIKSVKPLFDIKDIMKKIIYNIGLVVNLSKIEKTIMLTIYLTPDKKEMDISYYNNSNTVFNVCNINSGSTHCLHQPNVLVCRIEELYKVLIHELIHAMDYDCKTDNKSIDIKIQDILNISPKFNHFEAYTEIWANILNSYFISTILSHDSIHYNYPLFTELICYERQWSYIQTAKILLCSGSNVKTSGKINYDKLSYMNNETNVYAYFILRSFFYHNINEFIEYFGKVNSSYIDLQKNNDLYNNYVLEIVKKTVNNNDFIEKILKYQSILIDDIYSKKNKSIKDKLMLLSLRMSSCELEFSGQK